MILKGIVLIMIFIVGLESCAQKTYSSLNSNSGCDTLVFDQDLLASKKIFLPDSSKAERYFFGYIESDGYGMSYSFFSKDYKEFLVYTHVYNTIRVDTVKNVNVHKKTIKELIADIANSSNIENTSYPSHNPLYHFEFFEKRKLYSYFFCDRKLFSVERLKVSTLEQFLARFRNNIRQ
jgi:hypothetical protein